MNFDRLSPSELKKEKERLQSLYAFKVLNRDEESDFSRIIELAISISKKPIVTLSLIFNKNNYYKQDNKLKDSDAKLFSKFHSQFPKGEKLVLVPDTSTDARCNSHALVTGKQKIRFYAGIAIVTKSGIIVGTISIFDHKPGSLSANQISQLIALGSLALSLIDIREQKTQLELLNSGLLNALQLQLKEQNKVLNLFSRFVPPLIVKRHLKSEDANFDDAELKNLTVLFCDIRGYTHIVEHLHPSQAVAILKLYYEKMSDVINSFGGMVNQYVGDEIFATFGEPFSKPPYELQAVNCAVKMMEKMKDINAETRKLTTVEIKVRIGIHSGPVITGTMGSKEKIEYSVTGDTVNTGKRIESSTKTEPGSILISEEVYKEVKDTIKVIEKEPIVLKGKSLPVKVYQVVTKKYGNK